MNSRKSRRRSTLRSKRKKQLKKFKHGELKDMVIMESPIYQETQVYDLRSNNSFSVILGPTDTEGKEVDTLVDSTAIKVKDSNGNTKIKDVDYSIKVVDTFGHLPKRPVIKYLLPKDHEKVSKKKKK